MRKILLALALLLPVLATLPPARAQDAAEISAQIEDDKGFITRLLEKNLSGAGRAVVIDGFQGALSSRATFERMTIADAEGVWITLSDGAIQWNRSALLRGRIEIGELSAAQIDLPRLPGGAAPERKAEVREFALPDLPVAVNIDKIMAGRVNLGEPVIGVAAAFAVNGGMNLEGGEGTAKLAIDRLDGPRGQFALDAGFSNASKVLKLDLTLDEDANGLLVNLARIHDRPAITAEIKGEGPISDFLADIALATDGQPRVTGRASATAKPGSDGAPGTAFRLELGGDIATLLPPEKRTFFGPSTQLLAEGWRGETGRLDLPVLMIDTNALNVSGSLSTTDAGAPQQAVLLMTLGADAGATELPVRLPFGQDLRVNDGRLTLQYDAARGAGWSLEGRVGQVLQPGVTIGALQLKGAGQVALTGERLDEITGQIDFGATGLAFEDKGLAAAVGEAITGTTGFMFAPDNAVEFSDLDLRGADYGLAGDVLVAGLSGGITISGAVDARYENLSRLSALADRPLTGRADARIEGLYTVLTRGFDVDAEITGTDITLAQAQMDRLLKGQSRIAVKARRDETGIEISELTVNAQRLTAQAEGLLNSDNADLRATISMPSLADADPDFGGALMAEAVLNGPTGSRRLTISGEAQDLRLGIPELDGVLRGKTSLAVLAAESAGAGAGEAGAGGYQVQQFRLSNPQLTAEGKGDFAPGHLDARLNFDMADLAALGRGWSGALTGHATATETDGTRFVTLNASGQDLRLGQQDVDGTLTGTTKLNVTAEERQGTVTLRKLDLSNVQMTATAQGTLGKGVTDLTARADITSLAAFGRGWRGSLRAEGSLREQGDGVRRLEVTGTGRDLALGQAQVDGALTGTTQLALRGTEQGGVFTIEEAQIRNARLSATAAGRVGGGLTDVRADIAAGDLRFLGNGISGALNATGRVTEEGGTRRITAQGAASGLSLGQAKLDPLLAGRTTFDVAATQEGQAFSVQRLDVQNGQITLTASGSPQAGLTVNGRLADLALIQPGFPGPATVTGTLREDGPNFVVDLTGTAPGDTTLAVRGRAARDFSDTDLAITGSSDAAIANSFIRTRSIEGPVRFDLRLAGRPSLEALTGTVRLSDGRLAEPKLGVRLEGVDITATLDAGRITVEGGGAVADGGRIGIRGPVDLRAGTLDIGVTLDGVVMRDPNLYQATVNGDLRLSGVQAQGPTVSGTIRIAEAEIRIPSTGLGGAKAIPDIHHVGNQRPPVRATRAKAGLAPFPSADAAAAGMTAPPATPPVNPPKLDLLIDAPNRVFIRGRGVDAEMGGQMRITGTTRNVIPIGTLELIRGRVDLLGKRFDLTEGLVELQGSLIPVIRLVAETSQDGITTRVIIDGEARDPEIRFESSPDMPEEEVLSQLLFRRGLDNISPLQAAQLANAVAVLAGRGGEGIVGRLRNSVGLDDLDLATDADGNVKVRAGKYLTDNLYTDVSVGDDGKSEINLNLDINDALRARGTVASDGEGSLGLYYEKDY